MGQPGQSALIFTTENLSGTIAGWSAGGWLSGVALTRTIGSDASEYLSVYVAASGAGGAPEAAKLVDGISGATLAILILPATNGHAGSQLGPAISGANVANQVGFFNIVVPPKARIEVQHSASSVAWYRVNIYGR